MVGVVGGGGGRWGKGKMGKGEGGLTKRMMATRVAGGLSSLRVVRERKSVWWCKCLVRVSVR